MSNVINFCHISPVEGLKKYTKTNGAHLVLAHLVEYDRDYREFYASLDDGKYKIMDNSAFEMFKLGQPMYSPSKLIEMGKLCKADCIVMTDYPKSHSSKTIKAAEQLIPQLKSEGFDTFFVPQSELGQMDDLLYAIEWALNNHYVDIIGLSILACPIACGVNESTFDDKKRDEAYRLQRYLSRLEVFRRLEKKRLLNPLAKKRFHCLGMVDGPKEIDLLRDYHDFIFSWDSSAAVWAGMNNISFDDSPTGLMYGKYEREVDFHSYQEHDAAKVHYNINYINKMCGVK